MEPEGPLLCSQDRATCPYPEPDESNPQFLPYLSKLYSNFILPYTHRSSEWFLPVWFSDQSFVFISHLSPIRAICPSHLILLNLISLIIFVERTNYEARHYAVSSSLQPLPYPSVQMFSSAPCSQTSSVYVLPLMWETKFHIQTKQLARL
jgi:hypothetical protein